MAVLSSTAAGAASTAAMIAGASTQQQTMARTWPGRIPIALKMPRSWTLSRVVISTVLSTPRPEAIATISESSPIRALAMGKNCPAALLAERSRPTGSSCPAPR